MRIVVALLLVVGCASAERETAGTSRYCKPTESCWPKPGDWKRLAETLKGKLEVPAAAPTSKNPFLLQEHSGATQLTGWLGAWNATPSAYAVAAESAEDIVAAVRFARRHGLRLVVKSTGHDYLGRSTAVDSLLVWTHRMRNVTFRPKVPLQGCGTAAKTVVVEAGARWIEAYREVTVKNARYVQGGGCTSVGAAGGFLQGGGYGSWSRQYGVAAASLLEAEVVTAEGKVLTVNRCLNSELFWALRGGGGGTFGIVTKVTLATHELPNFFGWGGGRITAKSDADYKRLVERFLVFAKETLADRHWGEKVEIRGENELRLGLTFQGFDAAEATRRWLPFRKWVAAQTGMTYDVTFHEIPGRKMWDSKYFAERFPKAVTPDRRENAAPEIFWWTGDGEQVQVHVYAYQSRWLPHDKFTSLGETLFAASRHWPVELHFNKAQSGAAKEAVARGKETSVNPKVFSATAFAVVAAGGEAKAPDAVKKKDAVGAAMKLLRDALPGAGTYVNEADYFEPNWREEFWGENYPKLLEVKRKYDPESFFTCHHCVGSEG